MAMMNYAIGFTGLNLIFLVTLLGVYYKNYVKMKASINLGLVIFASVFAIQKIVSLYVFLTMMDYDVVMGLPMFILEILETFAFSSLLWVTVR